MCGMFMQVHKEPSTVIMENFNDPAIDQNKDCRMAGKG